MAGRFLALVILLSGSFSAIVNGKCPCEDQSLCEPIARPPGKEFLMFSTKPNVWRKYDWTKVTTIALFRPWDDELMCEAHKRVTNQSIYLSVILLTFFAGLLSWWRFTKSFLSKRDQNLVMSLCRTRDDKLISDFISLEFTRKEILLLCSHSDNFKCVRQRLNASFKFFLFIFRNFRIIWCRSRFDIQISLHSDVIDWFCSWSIIR